MIKHIVMWKLKPEVDGQGVRASAERIREALIGLKGLVPEIRSLTVGINVLVAEANSDLVLETEFDDLAALERYQKNPDHLKVADLIASLRLSRTAVDYEF